LNNEISTLETKERRETNKPLKQKGLVAAEGDKAVDTQKEKKRTAVRKGRVGVGGRKN
jgi:hypothetical protein